MYIFFTFFQADRQKYFFYIFNFFCMITSILQIPLLVALFLLHYLYSRIILISETNIFYATFSEVLTTKEQTQ